jgi:tRNA dimethylallyltransferase
LVDEAVLTELVTVAREGILVAVVGPTASGKTELACSLAERVDGEVVSADSVQIYTRFDVGSGKPTESELARAPHHLVGALDPHEPVDAARFASLASGAIDDIRARGKVPIVSGGTFLWVKALIHGLVEAPPASEEVRARHRGIVEKSGRAELHRMLSEVDAASAARLHVNDALRVGRALEVYELTGTKLSEAQEKHAFAERRYPSRLVARTVSPDALTGRIEQRARAWLGGGWIEEVRALIADGYEDARAMGSVGYREVAAHVRGDLDRDALLGAVVRATRVFARRQRTWLNHADVAWLEG